MAIDVSQIHNLVRTYQRALHDSAEPRRESTRESTPSQEDRVSLSAEAREHGEPSRATPPQKNGKA
jgi:hypothetical protein